MKRQFSKGERVWIQELIDYLRELESSIVEPTGKWGIQGGICDCLDTYIGSKIQRTSGRVMLLSPAWPLYSGDIDYPVPSIVHSGFSARSTYKKKDIKWGDDAYGDNRRELCEFLADTIEELTRE